jgi:NADH dehydrogenase
MKNDHVTLLLTGATGSIGQDLQNELLRNSYNLIIVTKSVQNRPQSPSRTYVCADMRNKNELQQALATHTFDSVIHAAAVTRSHDEKEYYAVNVEGTRNLLEICTERNISRFVYVSSRAHTEMGGAYAKSKMLAEKEVRASHLPWIILAPAEVYGGSSREAIATLSGFIKKWRVAPIIGTGLYTLAPLYIEDFVHAVLASLQSGKVGSEYVLAGPEEITYKELVVRLERILGVRAWKVHIPLFVLRLLARIAQCTGSTTIVNDQIDRLIHEKPSNIEAARQDLHFNPISLDAGLKRISHTIV